MRVLRTTCDVMSCVPLSVSFCESCVCLDQLATPSTWSSVGNLKLRTTCKYNTLIVWSMYCILSVHYFSGKTARKEGRRRGNCASALTHSAIFRGVFWQSGVSFLQTNREPPLSLRRSVRLSVSATDRRSATECARVAVPAGLRVQVQYQSLP